MFSRAATAAGSTTAEDVSGPCETQLDNLDKRRFPVGGGPENPDLGKIYIGGHGQARASGVHGGIGVACHGGPSGSSTNGSVI